MSERLCVSCRHFQPDRPGTRWGGVAQSGICRRSYEHRSAASKRMTWKNWDETTATSTCPYQEEVGE